MNSAQVSESFALKATEVRIQDARPDGTNPFPDDIEDRLEHLNGINHAGLSYPVPNTDNLQPRAAPSRPQGANTQPIPIVAASKPPPPAPSPPSPAPPSPPSPVGATSTLRGWTATLDPRILLAAPLIGLTTGALAGTIPPHAHPRHHPPSPSEPEPTAKSRR